jgi:hypothetical protein
VVVELQILVAQVTLVFLIKVEQEEMEQRLLYQVHL